MKINLYHSSSTNEVRLYNKSSKIIEKQQHSHLHQIQNERKDRRGRRSNVKASKQPGKIYTHKLYCLDLNSKDNY